MIKKYRISERSIVKNIDRINKKFGSCLPITCRTLKTVKLSRLSICLLCSLVSFATQSQENQNYTPHPMQYYFLEEGSGKDQSHEFENSVIVSSAGNYALDEVLKLRDVNKTINFYGDHLEGRGNAEQNFFTYNLRLTSSTKSSSYQNSKAIVSVGNGSDNEGGTFNFLSNNVEILSKFDVNGGGGRFFR